MWARLGPWRPGGRRDGSFSLDHPENIALFHDGEFFAVDLDLGARPFAEQNAVAFLDVKRHELAVLAAQPWAGRDHFSLPRLLFGRVGDDNPASGLCVLLKAAHDDPVVQRAKFHGFFLSVSEMDFKRS